MARTPRYLQAQVRSYEDATRRPFNNGSGRSQEAFVLKLWNKMRPIRDWLDSLRDDSDRPNSGNRVHYKRSSLLIFYVVALVLKKSIAEAYTFVQESHQLRSAAGLPAPSEETLRRLEQSRRADDVKEDGFPSRQTVMWLFTWLENWAARDVIDEKTGEIRREVSLDLLERYAYGDIPVEIADRFDLDLSRVAIDGKRIKSPRRRNDGKRIDEGANYLKREGEKSMLGRLKLSAVVTDLPVIVYSSITTDHERVHVQEELIDGLADWSDEMRAIAKKQGLHDFEALAHSLMVGDSGFHDPTTMRRIHDRGFYGAFRLRDSLTRWVIGDRRVTSKRTGGDDLELILDVCNDGVHLCPCDSGKHTHERRPMLQTAGSTGANPYVYVECENPLCVYHGIRFYVPFRAPDKVYASGDREPGDINHALVTPVSRALKDIEIAIFKGCQAIEHYHSQLLEKFGLGITDTKGRRKFSGDLRHRFYYALADAIWNLIILFNLEDGFAHAKIDREETWKSLLRKARQIRAKKGKTAAELAELGAASGDQISGASPKTKPKSKPPTFAPYFWRYQTS